MLPKSPTSFQQASLGVFSWQWYRSYLSHGAGNGLCFASFCAIPLANLQLTKASDIARPVSKKGLQSDRADSEDTEKLLIDAIDAVHPPQLSSSKF